MHILPKTSQNSLLLGPELFSEAFPRSENSHNIYPAPYQGLIRTRKAEAVAPKTKLDFYTYLGFILEISLNICGSNRL